MTSLFPNGYLAPKTEVVIDFDSTTAPVLSMCDLFGNPVPNDTFCKLVHDGENLYVLFKSFFKVKPLPTFEKHGNKVFRDDCVEIFVGNKSTYLELDVSAYNVLFSAVIKNDNGDIEVEEKEGLAKTQAVIKDGYYEVNYKMPLVNLKEFGDLYFNVFRVEMVDGARTSRSASKTDCLSHHESRAFMPLILEK